MKRSLVHKYFLVSARTKFGHSPRPTQVSHPCLLCPSTYPQRFHTYASFSSLYNNPSLRFPRTRNTNRCKGCLNCGLSYYADSMARSRSNATTTYSLQGHTVVTRVLVCGKPEHFTLRRDSVSSIRQTSRCLSYLTLLVFLYVNAPYLLPAYNTHSLITSDSS